MTEHGTHRPVSAPLATGQYPSVLQHEQACLLALQTSTQWPQSAIDSDNGVDDAANGCPMLHWQELTAPNSRPIKAIIAITLAVSQ